MQESSSKIDEPLTELTVDDLSQVYSAGEIMSIRMNLRIPDLCIIDPVLRISIRLQGEEGHLVGSDSHQGGMFYPWLPRGTYQFSFNWPVSLPGGDYEVCTSWGTVAEVRHTDVVRNVQIESRESESVLLNGTWGVEPETQQAIDSLSWQKGMNNWFHRHFCHAAQVIGESFLKSSPLLKGRILDMGAGDGITDLGLFLRYRPEELVAMDIVDFATNLPRVAQENDLPLEQLPEGFVFVQGSCDHVPYPDSSFDVIISWGAVEHMKDGYQVSLDEAWRLLKPGGLFFVNPGLFYAEYGSHLGEFSDVPYLHLKIPEEELHELVMTTAPSIMDRSGFDVSNADYWRFYQELNRIRVADFETELKNYGYEVVRAAIRANEMVEYDAELQPYSVLDLAVEDAFFTLRKPDDEPRSP